MPCSSDSAAMSSPFSDAAASTIAFPCSLMSIAPFLLENSLRSFSAP